MCWIDVIQDGSQLTLINEYGLIEISNKKRIFGLKWVYGVGTDQ